MPITKGIKNPIVNAANVGNAKMGKYLFNDFCIYASLKIQGMASPPPGSFLLVYSAVFGRPALNERFLYGVPVSGALRILKQSAAHAIFPPF